MATYLADAHRSGCLRTRREVCDALGVPWAFVPQILNDLIRSGLVVSAHGPRGGYRLARPPGEVRLLEVVEAGEGPLSVAGCVGDGASWGGWTPGPVQALWAEASTRFRRSLAATTLAELVDRGGWASMRLGSPPCRVLALPRRPAGRLRPRSGGLLAEHVGQHPVEPHGDGVRAASRSCRCHGGDGEDDAVEEDGEE